MRAKISIKGLSHIDNSARNKNIILNIIREQGPISRRDIAGKSNLSIATTKRLIEDLIDEGLVHEHGTAETKRGRKPAFLNLNPDYGYSIGTVITPHCLEFVGLNFAGEILQRKIVRPENIGIEETIEKITDEINQIEKLKDFTGRRLLGIGVGISGLIDTKNGMVLYCPNISGWENIPLGGELQKRLGAQVIIDDTVRCMALSEARYGSARALLNFLYIYIGDGVGAGIMLDGRFYRGKHGIAGEFGHITVKQNGPQCNCGNRGCLEASVSMNHIINRVEESLASGVYSKLQEHRLDRHSRLSDGELTLEDINKAAAEGDKLSNMVISEVGQDIGTGIADLINIFDPGVIVLGGEVVEAFGDLLIDEVKRTVVLKSLHPISSRTKIIKNLVKDFSAAIGAATLAIEKFLNTSIININ